MAQLLTTGPVYDDGHFKYAPQIVGENDSLIFTADIDYGDIIIESYRKKNLVRKYRKVIKTGATFSYPIALVIEDLLFTEGYFVYFTAKTYFQQAVSELYMHRVNALTGEEETKETVIGQMIDLSDYKPHMPLQNWLGDYYIASSEKSRRTVIIFSFTSNTNQRIYEYIIVYNERMERIKEKEIVRESQFETIPPFVTVDEEANLYFIRAGNIVLLDYFKDYEEWNEPLKIEGVASNGRPKIATGRFMDNGNLKLAFEHITVDIEDKEENKKRDDQRAGDTQVEGIGFMELNTLYQEVRESKFNKFDATSLLDFRTFEDIEKQQLVEVNDEYSYRWINVPGHNILLAEAGPNPNEENRHFNQIVVYSFDEKGKLKWTRVIHKDQEVKRSEQSVSYAPMADTNYLYLLFEDHPDNFVGQARQAEIEKWSDSDDHIPVTAKIRLTSGEMELLPRNDLKVEDFVFQPVYSRQLNTLGPVYIFMKDKGDYRLARLDLN